MIELSTFVGGRILRLYTATLARSYSTRTPQSVRQPTRHAGSKLPPFLWTPAISGGILSGTSLKYSLLERTIYVQHFRSLFLFDGDPDLDFHCQHWQLNSPDYQCGGGLLGTKESLFWGRAAV